MTPIATQNATSALEAQTLLPESGGSLARVRGLAPAKWWEPRSLDDGLALAAQIAGSSLVPKDYVNKPGNVFVAMIMGAELGLGPLASLQNIAVINGRPSVWGDAMLAICRAHPEWDGILEKEDRQDGRPDNFIARCVVKRKGEEPVESSFSVEDAKKAKLWGKEGPWQTYPKRMLKLRARAFALRDAFPDALRGLGSAEEAFDGTTIEVQPEPTVPAAPALAAPSADAGSGGKAAAQSSLAAKLKAMAEEDTRTAAQLEGEPAVAPQAPAPIENAQEAAHAPAGATSEPGDEPAGDTPPAAAQAAGVLLGGAAGEEATGTLGDPALGPQKGVRAGKK